MNGIRLYGIPFECAHWKTLLDPMSNKGAMESNCHDIQGFSSQLNIVTKVYEDQVVSRPSYTCRTTSDDAIKRRTADKRFASGRAVSDHSGPILYGI